MGIHGIDEYLLNLTGYFLQFLPFTLFLFLPFDESHCRISMRIGLTALNLVFGLIYPFFAVPDGSFDVCGAVMTLVMVILLFVLISDGFTRKVVALFIAYFLVEFQSIIISTIRMADMLMRGAWLEMMMDSGNLSFSGPNVLMLFLLDLILVPALVWFELKILKPFLRLVRQRVMWIIMASLLIASFLCYLAITFYIGYFTMYNRHLFWLLVPGLLLLLLALATLYFLVFRTFLAQAKEAESRLQMELLRENAKDIQKEVLL